MKAAIWSNATEHGPRFSVTFERLYREDGLWKSSSSFGRDDLLVLAKVADLAHTWTADVAAGMPETVLDLSAVVSATQRGETTMPAVKRAARGPGGPA